MLQPAGWQGQADSISYVLIEHSMSNENYIDLDEIPSQEDVTKFSLIIL